MKWLPHFWSALCRKPGRSIYTLLSIIVAFVLVGSMTGLNAAFSKMVTDARADGIIVTARYGAWVPLAHLNEISELPGVTDIVPIARLEATYQAPRNSVIIMMTDSRITDVQPDLNTTREMFSQLEQRRDGLIVSRDMAQRFGWSVGDLIPLETDRAFQDGSRNWTFQLVGIVPGSERFPGGFAMGNFDYFNEGRADGRINDFHQAGVVVENAEQADETSNAIEGLFANSANPVIALPERTMIENLLQGLVDTRFFTYAISAAGLFMLLFLTGNVVAQSVRERIPEFAVMKTIGFSDRGVFALVVVEAAFLCIVGAAFGLVLANAIPGVVSAAMPNVPVPIITPGVIAISFVCAVLVAVFSALPAAWRVKRLSIAKALGGR